MNINDGANIICRKLIRTKGSVSGGMFGDYHVTKSSVKVEMRSRWYEYITCSSPLLLHSCLLLCRTLLDNYY